MLLLTRRIGTSIHVGAQYRVTLVHLLVRGGARLRIECVEGMARDVDLDCDASHELEPGIVLHHCGARDGALRVGVAAPRCVLVERAECRGRYAAHAGAA